MAGGIWEGFTEDVALELADSSEVKYTQVKWNTEFSFACEQRSGLKFGVRSILPSFLGI